MRLLAILIGGALGALARVVLAQGIDRWTQAGFPYGVLLVNLLGCFLIGLLATLLEQHYQWTPHVKTFALAGFLGSFTTFSTWIYNSWELLQADQPWLAFGNVMGSVTLGFLAIWLGMRLAVQVVR